MTRPIRAVAVTALLAAVLAGCGPDPAALAGEPAQSGAAGDVGAPVVEIDGDAGVPAAQIEGLLWMREEEKLARDVYLAFFDRWGAPIFENIAASEQRHTDAVLALIEAFGLEDPVVDDTPGAFRTEEFAGLYEDLVEQGSASLADALAVGALVEELDIWDLRRWLDGTDNTDIVRVYGNLLAGSQNHLRAFVGQLEANGGTFDPQHLDADDVEAILQGSSGRRGNAGTGAARGRGPGRRP